MIYCWKYNQDTIKMVFDKINLKTRKISKLHAEGFWRIENITQTSVKPKMRRSPLYKISIKEQRDNIIQEHNAMFSFIEKQNLQLISTNSKEKKNALMFNQQRKSCLKQVGK